MNDEVRSGARGRSRGGGRIGQLGFDSGYRCQHAVGMSASGSFDYDVAVIGGGSAGYAAARTTTAAGLRTVVIEGGAEVGGLCILRGCMPTKAVLQSAEVLHQIRRASVFGLSADRVGFDFAAVMARKDQLVAEFAA